MRWLSSYALGLVFIFLVSVIWSAASVLVQFLYTEESFDSPFLLTYLGVSLFTILLPTHFLLEWCGCKRCCSSGTSAAPAQVTEYESLAHHQTTTTSTADGELNQQPQHWNLWDHFVAGAKIAPVWFLSNYSYNASLKYTSITSSTVLASTGSLFTFIFALILKDEHFSCYKLLGVTLGMLGSLLTSLHDAQQSSPEHDQDERLWGDFLGLVSAVGYGGYAVLVRVLLPHDESLFHMQLFLGFVGLVHMIVLSPIAIWQVVETNSLTWLVLGCLVAKGLLDNVLSDYLWARGVVLTSATVATVGLGLTIPLAFVSDVVLGNPGVMDLMSVGGAISVLVGFILVNVGQTQVDGDGFHGADGEEDGIWQDTETTEMGPTIRQPTNNLSTLDAPGRVPGTPPPQLEGIPKPSYND